MEVSSLPSHTAGGWATGVLHHPIRIPLPACSHHPSPIVSSRYLSPSRHCRIKAVRHSKHRLWRGDLYDYSIEILEAEKYQITETTGDKKDSSPGFFEYYGINTATDSGLGLYSRLARTFGRRRQRGSVLENMMDHDDEPNDAAAQAHIEFARDLALKGPLKLLWQQLLTLLPILAEPTVAGLAGDALQLGNVKSIPDGASIAM